jgi:two-component system chemotaxis response regulator CheB
MNRLVVIGASSGGIEALTTLVRVMPANVGAAICVVNHTAPDAPAILHQILARAGTLPATLAKTGDRLRHGHVYVAPPDHHLLIEPGVLCLSRGPRENRFRPAIDPLFRSAAQVYGPRVIGVVLTGNLDDGAAGLWAIRQLGGIAVVQDPATAMYSSMPTHALRRVPGAHVAPLEQLGPLLCQLVATSVHDEVVAPLGHLEVEVRIAKDEPPLQAGVMDLGSPSLFTCPECHGALLKIEEDSHARYRCHTGHAYSMASLVAAVSERIDDALGNAERALQEGALLIRHRADGCDPDIDRNQVEGLRAQADELSRHAQVLRQLLSQRAVLGAGGPA